MVERPNGYRLSAEGSPFLRSHSADLVDWYPWGEEAIRASRSSGLPIFLSIGYSTCHWCRMMARESFSQPEVAQQLNETFVSILVDREQLPQVDALYMELGQAMAEGAAGWPLNLFLTPDLAPFFVSTYLPAVNRRGLVGLKPLAARIQQLWNKAEDRERLIAQADELIDAFREEMEGEEEEEEQSQLPTVEAIELAGELLFRTADPLYGGTLGSPKFPLGSQIGFLLRLAHDRGESRALFFTELTLESMARGGIYDQLGGGFSHYTLDARWRLPHFEKLLSDNALLAATYLEAWQATHRPLFKEVASATLDFCLRELRHPDGGLFCALDTDGGAEELEGSYYIWTAEELLKLLGQDDGSLFCAYYDVMAAGPKSQVPDALTKPHILHASVSVEEFAERIGVPPHAVAQRLEKARTLLLEARSRRPKPQRDEKITIDWNGLCIHALAAASNAIQEHSYLEAAQQTAQFIQEQCWMAAEQGQQSELLRCWYDGVAQQPACLNDYACLIYGLITLFEAGGGSRWLQWALELADCVEQQFKNQGGYTLTREADLQLPVRLITWTDDGEPAGNGLHCQNLLRLYRLTGQELWKQRAESALTAAAPMLQEIGVTAPTALIALQQLLSRKSALLVIALAPGAQDRHLIEATLSREFLPYVSTIWRDPADSTLLALLPFLTTLEPQADTTAIYIRQDDEWEPPITDLDALRQRLHTL